MENTKSAYENDASLYGIVMSLARYRRFILIASLAGGLIGAAVWWGKGFEVQTEAKPVGAANYAEWKEKRPGTKPLGGMTYFEWKGISDGLPALAESRIEKSSGSSLDFYRTLSDEKWWASNARPQFMLSKTDLKELGSIAKEEQEQAAVTIASIVLSWRGRDRAEAVSRLSEVKRFLSEGSLFLALKSIVERYDLEARRSDAETASKIAVEERELAYRQRRATALDELRKQYPDATSAQGSSLLATVSTESAARYLPVAAQLLAVKADIIDSEEKLSRFRDSMEEARVKRAFVSQALPLVRESPDGFELAKRLETVLADVRKGADLSSKAQVAAISEIAQQVTGVHERAKTLFESGDMVSVVRPGRGLAIGLGILAGAMLGALGALVRTGWSDARRRALGIPTR